MEEKQRKFHHLEYRDRLRIEDMYNHGASIQAIADKIHFSYHAVYRELRRKNVMYDHLNSDYTTTRRYSADKAQQQYDRNKRAKGGMIKLGHDYALHDFIEQKIGVEGYSPEAVIMEIKMLGLQFDVSICAKTIYNYIDSGDVFLTITNKDLPEKSKQKREYKTVKRAARAPAGDGIENRPEEINRREEPFHWEMDTVKGKQRTKRCNLMLTERVSRMEIVMPMANCTMEEVVAQLDRLERRWGKHFKTVFKSITVDNGSEFQDCGGMETSLDGSQRTKVYYCHPYRSSERGSNENLNKMFRRKFPKGTNFDKVADDDILAAAEWMNNYPRKLLGGITAGMMFGELVRAVCGEEIA